MVKNFDDNTLQEQFAENPDLIHFVKSNSNKPLSISRPIPSPNIVTNLAYSLLIGPNNTNIDGSGGENVVVIDSTIKNEETKELNNNTKVGLKVQSNTTIMVLVSHWPTIVISTLMPVFPVFIFVYRQFASIYNNGFCFPESNFRLMSLMQSSWLCLSSFLKILKM